MASLRTMLPGHPSILPKSSICSTLLFVQGQRTLNPLRHKGLRSSKAAFLGEF